MLQQTQVSRVQDKYQAFLKQFPTLKRLKAASRADVIRAWQGLGYNRRAVALHKIAQSVMRLPEDPEELMKLPGIGPYTASAIAVFAFGKRLPMIETNIRRVFIHEFGIIHDREIFSYLAKTPQTREWYYALMDYGTTIPRAVNRRSKHYIKQSKFEGSNRQVRGAILRVLTRRPSAGLNLLVKLLDFPAPRIRMNLVGLMKEGLIASAIEHHTVLYRLA